MKTFCYECGCSITSSMFGDKEIMSVNHCESHSYMRSQDKSLKQMSTELHEIKLHELKNP